MPEPVQVLPDLYQLALPTPFPVGPVNVYIARDADGLTLVDCGPRTAEGRAALDAGLAALGYSVRDVRRIVVTHAHADHYGLAASLVSECGAQVLTHPFNRFELESYDAERERRLAFYIGVLCASGVPDEVQQIIGQMRRSVGHYSQAVRVAGTLDEGDDLVLAGRAWRVLHTPGHSAGLVCLYEPGSRVLLSNDHLLRDISSNPLVEPPPPGRSERIKSLVEYIAQMERVASMEPVPLVAWPGHGEPIHDVRELVRQRAEFHTRRAGGILEILDGDRLTVYQVARRLFPKLDALNFFLAVSEVTGHLELLETRGHASSTRREGVDYWHAM